MRKVMMFEIFGMETEPCAKAARDALCSITEVEDVEINLMSCRGLVHSSTSIHSDQIIATLESIGFHAELKDRVDLP